MNTELFYCPRCQKPVHLASTRTPGHLGQANLVEDVPELVCLDYVAATCTNASCAATGEPPIVMGVRLARSELKETPWQVIRAHCPACDLVTEIDVIDAEHGFCTVCNSTVSWVETTRPRSIDASPSGR